MNSTIVPKVTEPVKVLDLFAGCGGLSLGFEAAGYETIGFEMVKEAAATYNQNLKGTCYNKRLAVGFEYPEKENIDIVIGGPPCQPFSRSGIQKGIEDSRDGFPIFIDAVERLRPKAFLFENVANLLGRHKWYFDQVVEKLRGLGYIVEYRILNAKEYGVPQNRERLITVGHRSAFTFPAEDSRRVTVGDAIGDTMASFDKDSRFLTPAQDAYIANYEAKSKCKNPRDLYPDRPARTLTCRNLAGATSDMQRVRLPDGRRRMILDGRVARLVVLHEDRLLRFGVPLVRFLCERVKTAFEVVESSPPVSFEAELAKDVVTLMTVFCARLYGRRGKAQRKTDCWR